MLPGSAEIGPQTEDSASGLRYRLRQAHPAAAPAGRLILLHGVGSNETSLAGLAALTDPRVQVVLVRGPLTFAPGQYGFFEVSFQGGAPAIDAAQADRSRRQLITLVRALHALDRAEGAEDDAPPVRTVIGGFSQGGIMSAGVALSAPADVTGFAVLSGRILPEIEPHIAPRAALAGLSAFIAHGEFDNKLPVTWAQRAGQWLDALGVAHSLRRYPIGHELNENVVADFQQWLAGPLGLSDPGRGRSTANSAPPRA
ncbi:alpha/beta hydrolase [Cupriavidus sp. 2TAF22]|uniref:alpha/beta hydrolase n=1 Tax=unclassified Cupriavidus TaxID=2640874 RepID=UPI003F8F1032